MRFNETLVFGDKYKKNDIVNWETAFDEIDKEKWFVEFNKESKESNDELQITKGVVKRKRGRPKKTVVLKYVNESDDETEIIEDESYHALLTRINKDPVSYREAMRSTEKRKWKLAILDELESMNKK